MFLLKLLIPLMLACGVAAAQATCCQPQVEPIKVSMTRPTTITVPAPLLSGVQVQDVELRHLLTYLQLQAAAPKP
ncbi:hypothetical protein [Leeia sp.]|uniref:hypothetical protein n=1 Tax=Leeia sp. TaxID=2884678 RepID=UPI0035AFE5A0